MVVIHRLVVLSVLVAATSIASDLPWYASYEAGLDAFRAGDHAAARRHFEEALEARPEPGLHVPTTELHSVDYFPHLYLAICAYHTGDIDTARHELEASEASGAAAGSTVGAALLTHYRTLLFPAAGAAVVAPPAVVRPAATEPPDDALAKLRAAPRKPEVLDEDEVVRLARETLVRCGLPADTLPRTAPWYFHYELGQRLAEKGDAQRAVDALLAATERKPLPDAAARMYGMWFIAYRPYLEIAANHAELGNWECAFSALELSERTGEVRENRVDEAFQRHRSLLDEVKAHLATRNAPLQAP